MHGKTIEVQAGCTFEIDPAFDDHFALLAKDGLSIAGPNPELWHNPTSEDVGFRVGGRSFRIPSGHDVELPEGSHVLLEQRRSPLKRGAAQVSPLTPEQLGEALGLDGYQLVIQVSDESPNVRLITVLEEPTKQPAKRRKGKQ